MGVGLLIGLGSYVIPDFGIFTSIGLKLLLLLSFPISLFFVDFFKKNEVTWILNHIGFWHEKAS